jgi:hypothetical protein
VAFVLGGPISALQEMISILALRRVVVYALAAYVG